MRASGRRGRRWWLWGAIVLIIALILVLVGIIALPILMHRDGGLSHQQSSDGTWAGTATARGDDGRTRSITVRGESGGAVDPGALAVGDRIVVEGSGFDASQGIYVAVCVVPASPAEKPGPCVGGAPQEAQDAEAHHGEVQWAASNWINDDWAWRLFGSRSYDDAADGTFTAYLELADPGEIDCSAEQCAIVTRNDHTAAADRVQDVYLPIRLVG